MKKVNKIFLLFIICLTSISCEMYVSPTRGHNSAYESASVYSVMPPVSECGFESYEALPYNVPPWACYDINGIEYCEYVFDEYYGECMETWYYNWEWCSWDLYDESCYPI